VEIEAFMQHQQCLLYHVLWYGTTLLSKLEGKEEASESPFVLGSTRTLQKAKLA
jgi:hypothetical protein